MCTPWNPRDKNFLIYSNLTQKESNHNIHNIFPFEKRHFISHIKATVLIQSDLLT